MPIKVQTITLPFLSCRDRLSVVQPHQWNKVSTGAQGRSFSILSHNLSDRHLLWHTTRLVSCPAERPGDILGSPRPINGLKHYIASTEESYAIKFDSSNWFVVIVRLCGAFHKPLTYDHEKLPGLQDCLGLSALQTAGPQTLSNSQQEAGCRVPAALRSVSCILQTASCWRAHVACLPPRKPHWRSDFLD